MDLNKILQLATGIKNIEAKELSHFDYSDVISSESFGLIVNEKGKAMNAHFQLRIVGGKNVIANLELAYVPVIVTDQYYEIGHLREERTIRNIDCVINELLKNGYYFDGAERYWQ